MNFNKISKAQIKHIRSLHTKKFRQKYNQFMVEGFKSVHEFLQSPLKCVALFGSETALYKLTAPVDTSYILSHKDLLKTTTFKNPQEIIGIFTMPTPKNIDLNQNFIIALDDMRDPGNLGTIIRTADWYGLEEIVCSEHSVDAYNPKVIQASMGSLSRIYVHYVNLDDFLKKQTSHTIAIADMHGESYKNYAWKKDILVIGNEANGVGAYLKKDSYKNVTIPRKGRAESLNAAVSAAVIMSQVLG